jgi:hypothetical protein
VSISVAPERDVIGMVSEQHRATNIAVLQGEYMLPILKLEADALLAAGYQDIAWREVCSEAFGLPNPKTHVVLMATDKPSCTVDACLFSTVRRAPYPLDRRLCA